MNAAMIEELGAAFREISRDPEIRVVVLSGKGDVFCAGADVGWMRDSIHLDDQENLADAEKMAETLHALDRCGKPIIAKVHGAVLGGAVGLVAACDLVVASLEAVFAFPEVKLGIVPAVISPFVLAKMGAGHARRYFITAERFTAQQAWAMGLVHEVVTPEDVDQVVEEWTNGLGLCGPGAIAEIKSLLGSLADADSQAASELTTRAIARVRTSEEGQEGLEAFLEKRLPKWRERG